MLILASIAGLGNAPLLDFETVPTHTITVRATDNGVSPPALYGEGTITIQLIDVNERPVAMYRAEPRMSPWWR